MRSAPQIVRGDQGNLDLTLMEEYLACLLANQPAEDDGTKPV
jgi:hypothetical protein